MRWRLCSLSALTGCPHRLSLATLQSVFWGKQRETVSLIFVKSKMLNMVISPFWGRWLWKLSPAATIIQSLIVSGVSPDQKRWRQGGRDHRRGTFNHALWGIPDFSSVGETSWWRGSVHSLVATLTLSEKWFFIFAFVFNFHSLIPPEGIGHLCRNLHRILICRLPPTPSVTHLKGQKAQTLAWNDPETWHRWPWQPVLSPRGQ